MLRRVVPIAALLLFGGSIAYAQATPTLPASSSAIMMSWRSNGFAPSDYTGRVAAAGGGTVLVTAEEIVNGHPANLAGYEVRWYVNDDLYNSGMGMQSITVPVQKFHQDGFDVRVEIIGSSFANAIGNLSIPLTAPRSVIQPRTARTLQQGSNEFTAAGYSFNVNNASDLVYTWSVNGQAPQANEDPQHLTVTYDGTPNVPLSLDLSIAHPQNSDESFSTSLQVQPSAGTQ